MMQQVRSSADASAHPVVRQPRRAYIDWLRGLAVLCMILWHVVDSWHVPGNRNTATFSAIVFFAGWAAPMFLFLAGVSLPMAGLSRMARGDDRRAAAAALARRGWQVFLIAHLFRLQSFLLNPNASWNSLFKPDILNILGLGLVFGALAWGRAPSTRARVWWLLVPALVVAVVLTPWAPSWWWPSLLHPRLEGYIRIVNGNAVFSLFPAAAYILAGVFTGSLLAESRGRNEAWFHGRGLVAGIALLGVTLGSGAIPMPVEIRRWIGPMMIVGLRIGTMLVLMAVVWWMLRHRTLSVSDPMMVLGRTSLFVYWVHVELSYRNVTYPLHKALSVGWALTGFALMTLAMYAAALWWSRRVPAPLRTSPHGRTLAATHLARGTPMTAQKPLAAAPAWQVWALAVSVPLAAGLGWYAVVVQNTLEESRVALQDATLYVNQLSSELDTTRRDANMLVDTLRVLQAGDMVIVDLRGQANTPLAVGRAFVSRGRGVVFHAERLPEPARGRTYQLWVLPEGAEPVSAGTFDVNAFGMTTMTTGPSAAFARVSAVAVTDEPDDGSPGPTTTPLLVGTVPD